MIWTQPPVWGISHLQQDIWKLCAFSMFLTLSLSTTAVPVGDKTDKQLQSAPAPAPLGSHSISIYSTTKQYDKAVTNPVNNKDKSWKTKKLLKR